MCCLSQGGQRLTQIAGGHLATVLDLRHPGDGEHSTRSMPYAPLDLDTWTPPTILLGFRHLHEHWADKVAWRLFSRKLGLKLTGRDEAAFAEFMR